MKRFLVVALWAALLAAPVVAQDGDDATVKYYIGHSQKFVNIVFESDADLETIVGTTNSATGEIDVDPGKNTGKVELSVPVSSMKTGIAMRDDHLRSENWLDAAKHPNISFTSTKIEHIKDEKNEVKVTGKFTMHGVTKEIATVVKWKEISEEDAVKVGFPKGKWLKFNSKFEIKLSDFGVKVPDGAAAKVSDTWSVKMAIFAGTAKPEKK